MNNATEISPSPNAPPISKLGRMIFGGLLLLVFLAPLKFGNPVATQSGQYPPHTLGEWLGTPFDSLAWLDHWFVCAVLVLTALSLWDGATLRPRLPWLTIGVLLFQLLQVFSLGASVNVEFSHDTVSMFWAYCLLALLVARYAHGRREIVQLLGAVALGLLAVCWYAWWQKFDNARLPPSWDEIYKMFGHGTDAQRVMQKIRDGRAFAPFVYPNTLGGFLVVAAPAALAVIYQWRDRFTRSAFITLMSLAAVVLAGTLALTKSNGSFLSLGVMLGAVLLIWRPLQKSPDAARRFFFKKILIAGAGLLVLAGVFWFAFGAKRLSGGAATFSKRLEYWSAAVDLTKERPLLGWGPGAFGDNYVRYIKPSEFAAGIPEEPRMTHNGFLQVAADSGIFAFVLFAAIWVGALWSVARQYRKNVSDPTLAALWLAAFAGLVGWTVHELVDFDLYVPGVTAIAFVMLGLAMSVEWRENPRPPATKTAAAKWLNITGRFIGTVFLLGVVFWLIRVSSANYAHVQSMKWAERGDLRAARLWAERAVSRAPHSPTHAAFLGEVYRALRLSEEAEGQYVRAVALATHQANYYFQLGTIHWQRRGRVDEMVLKQLERAVELYPANPLFLKTLEAAQREAGQP